MIHERTAEAFQTAHGAEHLVVDALFLGLRIDERLGIVLAIAVAVASWRVVGGGGEAQRLLAPPIVALLLVVNLVAGIALMMLFGRRIAHRRAARSPVGGEGRLHVRLVLLFSSVAAVPAILVTIFASLLFQYGVQFWYSDRARGVFENATSLTRASYEQIMQRWPGKRYVYIGDNPRKDFIAPNRLGWLTLGLVDCGANIHPQRRDQGGEDAPQHWIDRLEDAQAYLVSWADEKTVASSI